jgi:hypothetical protein
LFIPHPSALRIPLPSKTPVHGLLIDTATGRVEWVVNGYEASGLPLETQGAPEELPKVTTYAAGPVVSLGATLEPLKVKVWKPITETRPTTPPPPPTPSPTPPPVLKPPPARKIEPRRRY